MLKTIAVVVLLQAGLGYSTVVRAGDVNQKAPAADADKSGGINTKSDAKEDTDCDCKGCSGKHGKKMKKSCKTGEHCKMHAHDAKDKGAMDKDTKEVDGATHAK